MALRYVTWAVYLAVFLLVLRPALRTPTQAYRDIAVFFGITAALIMVVSAEAVLGAVPPAPANVVAGVLAMALPYIFLRLVAGFASVASWRLRAAEVGLAACVVALVLGPDPTPAVVTLFLVAYFVGVMTYDTAVFVREALRSTGVTRRRMQFVASGSVCLAATVVTTLIANADPAHPDVWIILMRLLGLASGLAYYVGFSPPSWLRRTWQTPALQAFLTEVTRLPGMSDLVAVLTELEVHTMAVLGAPSAAIGLWQPDERVLRFWRGLGPRATPTSYPDDVESHGFVPHADVIDVQPERLFSGRAFIEQRPIFAADVLRADPANAELYRRWNVRAVMAAPITSREQRLGLVTIWSPRSPIFAESDLELVKIVAQQAAAVLESRVMLEELAAARARVQTDQLKDAFLASISHDLRNPLAAVTATAQLVQRRLQRDGELDTVRLQANITSIHHSATQMIQLVDQLLDYGRLQLDRPLELNRQSTDLVAMARRVVATQESTSERHDVRVETAEVSLVGMWDQERLERVLQNLLNNAIKYSPDGGTVLVGVRRDRLDDRPWAVLSVRDEGLGIPAKDLADVFNRFHRAQNVRQIAGTGIGLATARQVIELHGGAISVASEEGHGSTFIVRLPIDDEPGALDDSSHDALDVEHSSRSRL